MIPTLYNHQDHVLTVNPAKHFLAHGTGTGKTVTAIALGNKNKPTAILVVVPNLGGMLKVKWEKAIQQFGDPTIQWGIVTKEYFRAHAKDLSGFDALIWDEAHALGNPKSQMFKQCRAWIKFFKPKYVWFLSATPYLSDAPASVYAYGSLLGMDWKWIDFRTRFYQQRYLGQRVIFEPKKGIEKELADMMTQIGSMVELKDCIDLPPHIIENEEFELTKEQKALIKEVKEKESNPLVLYGKQHQIASGVLIGNEYEMDRTVHAFKNDRVLELARQHPKLAVFSRYNSHLDELARILAEADIPYGIINGESKDRPATLELLERSTRAVALINTSCSAGYELPSFTAICFASASFDYVGYVQSLGRFDRANQEVKPRVVYHLITKGTLDEEVMASLSRKETFSIELYLKKIGTKV